MKKSYQIDWKRVIISVLRMAVGWHFLYEGISKLTISNWSSYSYLANSTGPLSGLYHSMAASPSLLKVIDILNMYGLLLIGIALVPRHFYQDCCNCRCCIADYCTILPTLLSVLRFSILARVICIS